MASRLVSACEGPIDFAESGPLQGFGGSLRRDLAFHSRPRKWTKDNPPQSKAWDRCALRRQQIEKRELLAGDAPSRGEWALRTS